MKFLNNYNNYKMRILKTLSLVATTALILTSCSTSKTSGTKKITVPMVNNSVTISSPKKGEISEKDFNHWAHKDLETDTIPGLSLEKAYKFLEGKTGVTVIVGVIDSGIDIEHEDLKDHIWVNPGEIPNNGIDDDNNGYVDDVYGWNFLGGNGVDAPEQLEITRLAAKYKKMFDGKKPENIPASQTEEYKKYKLYVKEYEKASKKFFERLERLKKIEDTFTEVKKYVGKDKITEEDLKAIQTEDPELQQKVMAISGLLSRGFSEKEFKEYYNQQKNNKNYDLEFDGRAIVGDNPEDITDTNYGNPYVIGSKDIESHGTHVAGIILATRNNGLGMNGVAHNAKLMSIRAVPDGDERDKDVALAIRYAVDNGAKVINTSFGKAFSPNKEWVFDAIKYAASKDVLIVNAAGNDSKNIDIEKTYPNDAPDLINEISDNFLTVGAMSVNYDENLLATFTNYGKTNVDIFAPGVQIYSTVPKNEYKRYNGTSMASPEVAGVATVIRSYYPQLSASQVKRIIMNSGTPINMEVLIPGEKGKKASLSELSVSGKVANLYNALLLAEQITKNK